MTEPRIPPYGSTGGNDAELDPERLAAAVRAADVSDARPDVAPTFLAPPGVDDELDPATLAARIPRW